MVEASGSYLHQQRLPWESSTFRNCMIAPVEYRQHELLPVINPCRISANLGSNGLEFPDLPERGLTFEVNGLNGRSVSHSQTPFATPYEYIPEQTSLFPPRVDAQTSTFETPQQKRFLIFDKSGNETRLLFSSLRPQVQNLCASAQTKYPVWNQQAAPVASPVAYQFLADGQPKTAEQACRKTPILNEESGENETVHEGSEMHEDSEEIDALLYSDSDDDDSDANSFDEGNSKDDGDDDDEVSTGHSPLENREEEEDFDEVASFDRSCKRQKALDGGHNEVPLLCTTTMGKRNASYENMHGGELISALNEGVGPTVGNKRPRKDKIRDTLKVLESIIPGVKSKDPLVILDEAISYLKCLKSYAVSMPMEDPDTSSCYAPSS